VDEANYTAAPLQGYIHFTPGYFSTVNPSTPFTSATAHVSSRVGNAIVSVAVDTGGGPYLTPPAVVFTGGGGTGAAAFVSGMSAGAVTAITVTNGGSGYTSDPTVGFSASGGVVPIALGGTNATSAGTARTNLGAAASGGNGDITSFSALVGVTGSVTFTGQQTFSASGITDVPLTANGFAGQTGNLINAKVNGGSPLFAVNNVGGIGIGGDANTATGIRMTGTLAPTSGTTVSAINQSTTLKPFAANGTSSWANFASIANVGVVDLTATAFTAAGANHATSYGILVGAYNRAGGGHTYGDVFAVQSINPSAAITGGTYTLNDNLGHTTAAIAYNAAMGDPDSPAVGTVNAALKNAGILYRASNGRLDQNTNIGLTATTPGVGTAITLTPTGITGGTLSMSFPIPGQAGITTSYGAYVNHPGSTSGVNKFGLFVNAPLTSPGTPLSGSANEYGMYVNAATGAGTGSANGWQKNAAGFYFLQQQGFGTGVRDGVTYGIERDGVTTDIQAWVDDGTTGGTNVTNGFIWAMHVQTNAGFGAGHTTPFSSPANTIIMEAQVINWGLTDSGTMTGTTTQTATGVAMHQVGINMIAMGPQKTTAAYVIGASSLGGGAAAGQWHNGLWAQTASIPENLTDSFLEFQSKYAVRADGRTTIGSATSSANWMLDVFGEGVFRQIATGRPVLQLFGMAASTVDIFQIDASIFNAAAQKTLADKAGHLYFVSANATPPTQALFAGAGTSPTNTGCTATSNDQCGQMQFTTGTTPSASSSIITVTFAVPYQVTPVAVTLEPFNAQAATDRAKYFVAAISTTGFTLSSTSAGLTASQAYKIQYHVN